MYIKNQQDKNQLQNLGAFQSKKQRQSGFLHVMSEFKVLVHVWSS